MEMKDSKNGDINGEKPAMANDVIQNIMGAFGRYHFRLCILVFITKFFVAFNQMAIIFLAPKVSYYCESSGVEECPCPDPVYNRTIFSNTIVMEWDLICSRRKLVSFNQTMFQLGTLVGSVIFGVAADRYGRKKPLLVAVVLQLIAGVAAGFIPNYWAFTFVRLIIGVTVGGTMVTGFVIIMEFVGTQYRDVLSAIYQLPFNFGHMLLPLLAYLFRDYSHFHLAISAPAVVMLSYFIFLPETPRWLIAVKRTDEAIDILEKVAKVNKRDTVNIRNDVTAFQAAIESSQLKKGNITDLFRTPNIRKNIICVSINWLACSYCFYGVSQYVGQLTGDIFVNVASSASVTAIGTLMSIPLMKYFGRKTIIIVNSYICAICLIILAISPEGLATVILASVGVVCSFIVFVVIYLYTAEMFPTVVRNAAVGYCSMIARIGSMIAPFVIDLGEVARWLPPIVFAVVPLIAATIMFLLPETKNCELMTTIEEGEQFGKNSSASSFTFISKLVQRFRARKT